MSISVGLLQGYQLELGYALVGKTSLEWLPQVDELLTLHCGERLRTLADGGARWTNVGPRHSLRVGSAGGLDDFPAARQLFAAQLETLHELAQRLDARLLPSGMHPWMQPSRAESWPHGSAPADSAMRSLFGAARHGSSNQNPLRLSLPFASDVEFERLFAALRFAMPLLPALAASSPFAEGKIGPALDCRVASRRDYFASELDFSDSLVPPVARCRDEYLSEVVRPLERALKARELERTLQPLELCAHGLTADFDAGLVHLHSLDMQECLQADLAVCAGVSALVTFLQGEESAKLAELGGWPRARLAELLESALVEGSHAVVRDREFLSAFAFPGAACRMSELWQHLLEEKIGQSAFTQEAMPALWKMARSGTLAQRMLQALPERWTDENLYQLYREIAECLVSDELFDAS